MIDVRAAAPPLIVGEPADVTLVLVNESDQVCTDIVCVLDFPGFVVVRGSGRILIDRLAGGEVFERAVSLKPRAAGPGRAVSRNFSFRDHVGRAHRIQDLKIEFEVLAAASPVTERDAGPTGNVSAGRTDTEEPRLEITLGTSELPLNENTLLVGTVKNVGTVPVRSAKISLDAPMVVRPHQGGDVRDLDPGATADFSFFVQAQQSGSHVPITTRVEYVDGSNRPRTIAPRHAVRVERSRAGAGARDKVRLMFLAANPSGTQRLALDHELRTIRDVIERGTHRDAFDLVDHPAVRLGDISRVLMQSRARIVHFAGHGDHEGCYVVEADGGGPQRIRPEKLADLFAATTDDVECVVVNACHSMRLASELSRHVPYVVAMRQAIHDTAAIRFSTGFYQALAEAVPIDRAFRVGKAMAEAVEDGTGTDDVAVLVVRSP